MKYTGYSIIPALVLALVAAPSIALAAIDVQLDVGAQGEDVRELQAFLAKDVSIYPEGLVTGYYGSLTQSAVERFQCQEDIVCGGSPAMSGYGRVGPQTMTVINAQMGTPTGTGGSTDVWAPIMSEEEIVTAGNGASISWATNEEARSRVMYGTIWPFLYSTAPFGTDPVYDLDQTVVLSGLLPNTTYYYVRESVDIHGNVMWTTASTFKTK